MSGTGGPSATTSSDDIAMERALARALRVAVHVVLGDGNDNIIPRIARADPGSVPATGPSFGVTRTRDGILTGIDPGPLLDAVLVREACLLGFPPGARKRGFIQQACSWVAWRLARGAETRKAFWDAWAKQLVRGSAAVSLQLLPPVLLAEIDKVHGAKPLRIYNMLRTAATDSEALAGRITGMDDLIGWMHETVTTFTTPPDAAQVAVCLAATKLFVSSGRHPSKQAIEAAASLAPATFARAFKVASTWLTFSKAVNIGFMDHAFLLIACTSPLPPSTVDALLDIPGMTVRIAVARGALAGGAPPEWHTMLATLSVPGPSIPHVLRHVSALDEAGLFSTVDTWVLDATATTVNLNRHDPRGPRFVAGSATNAETDDPDRIVSSTVDYAAGRAGARAFLGTLPARRPDKFLKFLETVQSPFSIVRSRYGGELARLAATCGARKETIRDWLDARAARILVPHPRAFHHVLPYNPAFSTIIAVTRATMSNRERDVLAAPFVSWQSNAFHPAGRGKPGIFWQLRVPRGFERQVLDHLRETEPAARFGLNLVHEVSHRHYSFLPWYDFAAGAHASTGAIIDRLTASAVAVTRGGTSLATHAALVRDVASTSPGVRDPGA